MKNQNGAVIGIVVAILGIGAVALLLRQDGGQDGNRVEVRNAEKKSATAPREVAAVAAPAQVVAATPTPAPTPAGTPTPVPTPDPRDPENAPRKFLVRDFRELASAADYKLEGVILGPDGFTLPPPKPGEENLPRQGVVTSPAEPLDFPSNAVSPLWLESLPDGTDILPEFQVSPDGENWGPWQWVVVDEDSMGQMSPVMADGSPNPNVDYTPGGIYHWGDLQYNHMRYRFTLTAESADSPTVGAVRVFYQDSTLGEGRVAVPNVNMPTPTPIMYQPPTDDEPRGTIVE